MAKYPAAIPTLDEIFKATDHKDWTNAAKWNAFRAELRAALVELGTLPKGGYADVKARLDAVGVADKISEGNSSVEVIDTNGDGHVEVKTENVLCGKFHNDGILDLPKQSRCRAYRATSNQTIHNVTWTKVELNAETYDNQNEYDKDTNHRFTATQAGYYLICGNVCYEMMIADKRYFCSIRRNGVPISRGTLQITIPTYISGNTSDVVYLDVGDYVEMYTYHNCGVNKDVLCGTEDTFMSIHKLS